MTARHSMLIFRVLLAGAVLGSLVGCASVESTSVYYLPYSTKVYPPKPPETPIPILGRMPREPHTVIGRLAFETDQGWRFLRRSMIYNAQVNGADLVVLKNVTTRRETTLVQVPPQVDWVPVPNYYETKKGRVRSYTNWVPFFRPGYVQPVVDTVTGIDAEMVVLEK